MAKAIIIGAGVTGLFTAYELVKAGWETIVLERTDHVGGMASSFVQDDIVFDYGPHKIYTQLPGIIDAYREILGEDLITIKKLNAMYLFNHYFDFPPKVRQFVMHFPWLAGIRCGMSYAASLFRPFSRKENVTYEDYFIHGFGDYAYKLVFQQYAWKVWGNPKTLSEELARKRVPVPSVRALAKVLLQKKQQPAISAEYFYYPKHGFGELSEKLAAYIQKNNGKIIFNAEVTRFLTKKNAVTGTEYAMKKSKKKMSADVVISTLHLPDIPQLFGKRIPHNVTAAARQLRHRGLILAYFVFEKEQMMPYHWAFFPEKNIMFNRVSEQKNFSKWTMPAGKTAIIAEVTATVGDERWMMNEKELLQKILADLKRVNIYSGECLVAAFTKRAKRVYPVYAVDYKQHLATILQFTDTIQNFMTIGRQGLFNYNNTDHCIDMAKKAAAHILQNGSAEDWQKTRKSFDAYTIVD